MIKTKWKPEQELEYSLMNFDKVTIFSCGFCASLCDAGGTIGIRAMEAFLHQKGKEVVLAKVIVSCCSEEIMRQIVKRHGSSILASDALVMLSCSAGVKSAYLVGVGVPIIGALDTIGNTPITRQTGAIAESICETCGQCVLSYTGGICPVSWCPLHLKYGPCEQFNEHDGMCVVDTLRLCSCSYKNFFVYLISFVQLRFVFSLFRLSLPSLTRLLTPQVAAILTAA